MRRQPPAGRVWLEADVKIETLNKNGLAPARPTWFKAADAAGGVYQGDVASWCNGGLCGGLREPKTGPVAFAVPPAVTGLVLSYEPVLDPCPTPTNRRCGAPASVLFGDYRTIRIRLGEWGPVGPATGPAIPTVLPRR